MKGEHSKQYRAFSAAAKNPETRLSRLRILSGMISVLLIAERFSAFSSDLFFCSYEMPLLNGGQGCRDANRKSRILQFKEMQCQRQEKKKDSRGFVHQGMYSDQLFLQDKAGHHIDDFYDGNDGKSYPEPGGYFHCRQQFNQAHRQENEVSRVSNFDPNLLTVFVFLATAPSVISVKPQIT